MELSPENEKLCREVKAYPILYDASIKCVAARIEAAWEKIAEHCNDTPANCKQRWANIRTAFVRATYGSNKRLANRTHDYYLKDVLGFLYPHIWNFSDLDKLEILEEANAEENATIETFKSKEQNFKRTKDNKMSTMGDDPDIEKNFDAIKTFLIKQPKNCNPAGQASTSTKRQSEADKLKSASSSPAVTTPTLRRRVNSVEDPFEQPFRVLRTSKRTLEKSLEQNKANSNDNKSSKQKDTKQKEPAPRVSESKRRRKLSRNSSSPTKQERMIQVSNESDNLSNTSSSISNLLLPNKNANTSVPNNSIGYEPAVKIESGAPTKAVDRQNNSGVMSISPEKASKESDLPDYFEDLILLAEAKAKEHEEEEMMKLKAATKQDSGIQCKLHMDCLDLEFLEDVKRYMLEMNGRQKLHFKQRVYKSLAEVFDSSLDFPNAGNVISINDKEPQLIEQKLPGSEMFLIRELVSMVLSAKKTTELMKIPNPTHGQDEASNIGSGLHTVRKTTTSTGSLQTLGSPMRLYLPSGKVYRCSPGVKAVVTATTASLKPFGPVTTFATNAGKPTTTSTFTSLGMGSITSNENGSGVQTSTGSGTAVVTTAGSICETFIGSGSTAMINNGNELNLPSELLSEAIKISESGGGSITATDGNKRRVYRIYPKGTGNITNSTVPSRASGTFIIPQIPSSPASQTISSTGTTTSTTTTATTTAVTTVAQSGSITRPLTISSRPIVVNTSQSLNGGAATASPLKLSKNGPSTSTPNGPISCGQQVTEISDVSSTQFIPPLSLANTQGLDNSLSPSAGGNRIGRPPLRRYSICSPQSLNGMHSIQHIPTQTLASGRRYHAPMVTFKRSRYPHVANNNNGSPTHASTRPFMLTSTPTPTPTATVINTSPLTVSLQKTPASFVTAIPIASNNSGNPVTISASSSSSSSSSGSQPPAHRNSLLKPVILRSNTSSTSKTNTSPSGMTVPVNPILLAESTDSSISQNDGQSSVDADDNTGIISADDFFVNIKDEPMDDDPEFPNIFD